MLSQKCLGSSSSTFPPFCLPVPERSPVWIGGSAGGGATALFSQSPGYGRPCSPWRGSVPGNRVWWHAYADSAAHVKTLWQTFWCTPGTQSPWVVPPSSGHQCPPRRVRTTGHHRATLGHSGAGWCGTGTRTAGWISARTAHTRREQPGGPTSVCAGAPPGSWGKQSASRRRHTCARPWHLALTRSERVITYAPVKGGWSNKKRTSRAFFPQHSHGCWTRLIFLRS